MVFLAHYSIYIDNYINNISLLTVFEVNLNINEEKNITEEKLFNNLENVWMEKGSQPVYRDLNSHISKYSASIYADRFGNWRNALAAFVAYINEDEIPDFSEDNSQENESKQDAVISVENFKHRTGRNISDRMRFSVLSRDGFTCQSCGASPIKDRGVELHVDHIIPWSKNGETVESNLQTKCQKCNLGKGNAFLV